MRAKHCKQSKLALRVLSAAAVMAMVSSIAAPAFADAYGIATYGNYYLDQGSIRVVSTAEGTKVYQGDDDTEGVTDNEEIIIGNHKDKEDKSAVDKTITVNTDEGKTTNVTLDGVNIDVSDKEKAALTVKGNGTTKIELNGSNTLNSGSGHAGLEKNDSDGTGKLIIKDDTKDGGSLTANGGFEAAGIGSGYNNDTSNIEISGGKIEAAGNNGAGIGSGWAGNADQIKISDGEVTAIGTNGSAGIGDGYNDVTDSADHTCHIEISGGTVNAKSGSGAAIGSCEGETGNADIKITGGNITAIGGMGAGIGTGNNTYGNLKVDISGEDTQITASSIGSGQTAHGKHYDITIRDGKVDASEGIGTSCESDGCLTDILITGGTITAKGSLGGAGIGNGSDLDTAMGRHATTNITITGGTITAIGDDGAAGIGDGNSNYNNTVNVTITGGDITAIGGKGASAIGGAQYEGDTDPVINVKIDSSNKSLKIAAKVVGSGKGAIGNGTQQYEDPFSGVDFDTITADKLGEDHGALVQFYNNYDETTGTGTLYKTIHNQKYIAENYADHVNDDHAWSNPTVIKEAAPGKPGTIRYFCAVDGCDAQKDVSYDYVEPGDQQMREVGVIFWDAVNNAAAPDYLQGKTLNVEDTASAVSKAQADSVLADKEHWALAEDVGDLKIHPAADAAGTVYEQAVNASGCDYYVIANVTAQ